ncbi:hypothetical protein ECRM12581_25645 [Escherichia coli O145:H28 str. RM12581]|uniref:Uncharacterized protein n=1 Tax=Escherichia coli O145:H28 (strain RM12581) TaxID=1248823 RepID=A0ABC8A2D9_ECOLR|nr:hypothetical protein ECRM13514_5216 [Escherichia coli O145:H28 str. RM13514]AHY73659.1 hypothetical protein ECRM12581_25645 [Escherichia coli O145:H28 str. RM12581]
MLIVSVTDALLRENVTIGAIGGEVLAQKDSWISHDTYAWRYIF